MGAGRATDGDLQAVRLDRWLWAARLFKTRSLAAEAIGGGNVQVNGARVKRAKPLQVGDTVRIRKPPFEYVLEVRGLSEHRGPASLAQTLYEETSESAGNRERLRQQLRSQPTAAYKGKGRPTKQDRRRIERLKRG